MASVSSNNMSTPTLLSIPREIRESIFSYLLLPSLTTIGVPKERPRQLRTFDLRLLRTCSQIYAEALSVFRRHNVFVRISTPFAEAEHWVSIHGSVPVVRTNGKAVTFSLHHLSCKIDPPRFSEPSSSPANSFVLLIEDLEAFTQHWFYTDVTNPGQNAHLRLTLDIKNPYAAAYDEDAMPIRLQRQLLEPFRLIKGLASFVVNGNHSKSIEQEVRAEQAKPKRTPVECLEETTRLKDQGNAAFKEQKWDEALQLYIDAFAAMFIICEGRHRSVWGDAYFQGYISTGQYAGQASQQVRIMLRITLIANVIAVYLKMGDYSEAKFWGMRSIVLIRESMGMHGT